jgi:amidase
MGSLRNPADYNNLFGMRPSFGRVPAGTTPEVFLQQLSTDGPMARTVTDLALLLATQAGPDERAPLSLAADPAAFTGPLERDLRDVRIAWLGDLGGDLPFEAGVLDLCRDGLAALSTIGCAVEAVVPDFPFERLWHAWQLLRHWLVCGRLIDLHKDPAKRTDIKPEARWEIENGLALSALDVFEASKVRSAWYQTVRTLFDRYDFLALPSAQVFPFDASVHWPQQVGGRRMDTYHRWMKVVIAGSLSGCPAISVPVGFNAAALPMGMQLIGRRHADLAVLQLAYAYERATQWVQKRPPAMD